MGDLDKHTELDEEGNLSCLAFPPCLEYQGLSLSKSYDEMQAGSIPMARRRILDDEEEEGNCVIYKKPSSDNWRV